ncbi:MAG: hypothetical protein JWN50_710, partial [Parcubacteria group bacterium]|nr:hypothetical protein [Parcubacteria group bacterium]
VISEDPDEMFEIRPTALRVTPRPELDTFELRLVK